MKKAKAKKNVKENVRENVKASAKAKVTYAPFEVADYLDSEEAIAEYLSLAARDENPGVLLKALGDVAKVRGISGISVSTTAPQATACWSSGTSCGRLMTPKVMPCSDMVFRQCS